MTIDARVYHRPDPAYMRALVEKTGLSQVEVARRIGISERSMRAYLDQSGRGSQRGAPYAVQVTLETLAKHAGSDTVSESERSVPP